MPHRHRVTAVTLALVTGLSLSSPASAGTGSPPPADPIAQTSALGATTQELRVVVPTPHPDVASYEIYDRDTDAVLLTCYPDTPPSVERGSGEGGCYLEYDDADAGARWAIRAVDAEGSASIPTDLPTPVLEDGDGTRRLVHAAGTPATAARIVKDLRKLVRNDSIVCADHRGVAVWIRELRALTTREAMRRKSPATALSVSVLESVYHFDGAGMENRCMGIVDLLTAVTVRIDEARRTSARTPVRLGSVWRPDAARRCTLTVAGQRTRVAPDRSAGGFSRLNCRHFWGRVT